MAEASTTGPPSRPPSTEPPTSTGKSSSGPATTQGQPEGDRSQDVDTPVQQFPAQDVDSKAMFQLAEAKFGTGVARFAVIQGQWSVRAPRPLTAGELASIRKNLKKQGRLSSYLEDP